MTGSQFLRVAPYSELLTHFRYFLNLRSQEGKYHSLILFRLTENNDSSLRDGEKTPTAENNDAQTSQLYAMESTCPHLGADMSHADIEEYESSVVAVCPWHRYDFDLKTGESMTGLRACTYTVQIRQDDSRTDIVWVETPREGRDWRLVELRPVSEEFADPPPAPLLSAAELSNPAVSECASHSAERNVIPTENVPKTLIQWAVLILNTSDPVLKVERTRHAVQMFRTGRLASIGHRSSDAPRPPDIPPRHDAYKKNTVDPSRAGKRKNRVGMLHALANIEQWAIDLSWDIIARFGPNHQDLPPAFFADFAKMALDESKHFTLLTSRLAALSPSTPYGSLPVHAGLWDSARSTFGSLRSRLAIIHLVHEARGLDVNPATIARFKRVGDEDSVRALEVIHADEVTHVTTGHRWFTWLCAREGIDPVQTFRAEVKRGFTGELKGPFNAEAREMAGMTPDFYEDLRGEMDWSEWQTASKSVDTGTKMENGRVDIAYEDS